MAEDEGEGAVFGWLFDLCRWRARLLRGGRRHRRAPRFFSFVDDLDDRRDAEEKDRREEQHEVHADPLCEAHAGEGAHGGAQRCADADEGEQAPALLFGVEVCGEGPSLGHYHHVEDADPHREHEADPLARRGHEAEPVEEH